MSYTPIGWQTGDTITAEKLNKMDPGWGVETAAQTLFNDSVTTESSEYGNEAQVSMTQITADTITVTFGGTDYTATKLVVGGSTRYGGVDAGWNYDFTEYPFAIVSESESTYFATETAGTFSIKIDVLNTTIETSDAFYDACNACVDTSSLPLHLVPGETTITVATAAKDAGRMMYFWTNSYGCFFVNTIGGTVEFVPENSNVSAYFDRDGIFGITES